MRPVMAFAILAAVTAQQVEIDRTVTRVYGTAIMASDIRQARLLQLFGPGPSSDPAVQTSLENRLLMLREATRGAEAEPAAAEIDARRRAWAATLPAGTDLPALLVRAGMTEQALDGWFRDNLRIDAYLQQRFGPASDPRRAGRVAEWIRDLRHRAGLK